MRAATFLERRDRVEVRAPLSARALVCLLLAGVTLLAFWPALGNGFLNFDDRDYVTKNAHVRAGVTAQGIAWALTANDAANWHPLTWFSHMLDVEMFGFDPWGHHLTNLLLHLANTVLLFLLLESATGILLPSAMVAALFGVHPLHVESVAWVAERKDVLSTLLWFATAWAWIAYARRPGPGKYLRVLAFFALGLMAKPMLVTVPLVLLLLDFWPLERWRGQGRAFLRRTLAREMVPMLILSAASASLTVWAQRAAQTVGSLETYPIPVRIANATVSYAAYLVQCVWPFDLAVYYPHPKAALPPAEVLASAALLVVATAAAVLLRRSAPYLFVGWFWYVVTLVPVIGLVQVGMQARADRYTYVSLVGVFVAAAFGFDAAVRRFATARRAVHAGMPRARRWGPWIFPALLVSLLVVNTRSQVALWHDSVRLFEHTLSVTADNAVAQWILGSALADEERWDEAMAHYQEALRIRPGFAEAHDDMGVALAARGRFDEAIRHYRAALERMGNSARVRANLGHALQRAGRTEEALQEYLRAIGAEPERPGSYNDAGAALVGLGRPAEAIPYLEQALRLAPGSGAAHANMAAALYFSSRYAEAWREVRLARAAGVEPPPNLLRALSERMPEPRER